MRLISLGTIAFLFCFEAFAAAPAITGGSGYSNVTLTGTPTFYGGIVFDAQCTLDNLSTCDSCAAITSPLACNTTSVYGTLELRVSATHADAGNLIITKGTDKTRISTVSTDTYAGVTWDTICNNFASPGLCNAVSSQSLTLKLVIDKDRDGVADTDEESQDFTVKLVKVPTGYNTYTGGTEGVSNFEPYPGDEKVYIENPVAANSTLSLSYNTQATKLRVFMSATNMADATPGTGLEPQDLTLVENGTTLEDSKVDGLTNGVLHFFRIGVVDEGNNVVLLFPVAGTQSCDAGTLPCAYAATPDEVIGLLTSDMNCFVASAAYGSSLEPKLNTFREFRFKRLLPYAWGRKFVKWYYHYGPYLARYIHDKPMMRAGARLILWPAYGFSKMALSFGLWPATAFTFALISLLLSLPFLRVRRSARRE